MYFPSGSSHFVVFFKKVLFFPAGVNILIDFFVLEEQLSMLSKNKLFQL